MKLCRSLISFVFLAGSFAAAQYTRPQPQSFGTAGMENLDTPSHVKVATAAVGCPVSLHADHGADGSILKVDKTRPKGLAQLLHLMLVNPDARQIVAGDVTVRGISGKGRMTKTENSAADNSSIQADVVRNLHVRFAPREGRNVAGDVWAAGMSAVLTVELNSVTFADGSLWRFAGRDGCRVTPDPLMLIADK